MHTSSAATGPRLLTGCGDIPECLLLAAVTPTVAELYNDLHVILRDGSERQGAVRKVVLDKHYIVHMGAVVVVLETSCSCERLCKPYPAFVIDCMRLQPECICPEPVEQSLQR